MYNYGYPYNRKGGKALGAGGVSPFQILVKSDNTGASTDTQFTIPTNGGETYDYNVEWYEDGNEGNSGSSSGETGDATIEFGSAGNYVVKITGDFPQIYFNNGGDKAKLLEVQQWGGIAWLSLENSFWGCSNMNLTATDTPDLSSVTSARLCFAICGSFTGNSSVGSWDVSNIQNMNNFFSYSPFNQDISGWDIGSVTDMNSMFRSNASFDQDLSSWDFSNVTNMGLFLQGGSLSTVNYDALLVQLESTNQNNSVSIHGGSSTYTSGGAGETARTALINDHSWTFTDGGAV